MKLNMRKVSFVNAEINIEVGSMIMNIRTDTRAELPGPKIVTAILKNETNPEDWAVELDNKGALVRATTISDSYGYVE